MISRSGFLTGVVLIPLSAGICSPVRGETVTHWALHYDRPDYGGWGIRVDKPDLLISSSGRYEFLDLVDRIGTCIRRDRWLGPDQLASLEEKLFPVLSRYELDPYVHMDCTVTDVGDGSELWFRYGLSGGRIASFRLPLQPYWCDSEALHGDIREFMESLRYLSETLPPNCSSP